MKVKSLHLQLQEVEVAQLQKFMFQQIISRLFKAMTGGFSDNSDLKPIKTKTVELIRNSILQKQKNFLN